MRPTRSACRSSSAQKAFWLLFNDDDGISAAESYGNDYFIPNFRREVLAFAANAVYYATALVVLIGVLAFALAKDVRRLVVVLAFSYVLAIPLSSSSVTRAFTTPPCRWPW